MTIRGSFVAGSCLLCLALIFPALSFAQAETKLPPPRLSGNLSVEAGLAHLKSVRSFSSQPLTLEQASQLLWAANGSLPTDAVTGATMKVVPSAGGLYPIEVYLVAGKDTVSGLPAGVYEYSARGNSLKPLALGDNRLLLSHACLSQTWLASAPALMVIGGAFARTTSKYGNRGIQYVCIEAGNTNQNVYLQAQALGLKAATVGAFQDAQVASVLKLPTGVTPLLVMAVGK